MHDPHTQLLRPTAFIVEVQPQSRSDSLDGRQNRLRLVFRLAGGKQRSIDTIPCDSGISLIGSDAEWDGGDVRDSMGAAVTIAWDRTDRCLRIRSSVLGLPPVFVYRSGARTIVTSDLWLLRCWPGIELSFDAVSLRQTARIGYPVGCRTLFTDVTVVPGGTNLDIDGAGKLTIRRGWRLPAPAPLGRWEEFTELQADLFRRAVRRIDTDGTFLSLTGGLDTRAILAVLMESRRGIPACTMSWKDVSLDAVLAGELCRDYGIRHHIVSFDESFATEVADRALTATRLSGGLGGIDQATEVAFYERIGETWRTRVSGCFGNQVGRGGSEQLSPRDADIAMLEESWRTPGPAERESVDSSLSWRDAGLDQYAASLEHALFASIGNYCVGHHFHDQASPYADRHLVESLAQRPYGGHAGRASLLSAQLRDLRHRFAGEAVKQSFQRQVIASIGGPAAVRPINWGWRAQGGTSTSGLALGLVALFDALSLSRTPLARIGRGVSLLPGVVGRHSFRQPRLWWSRELLESVLLDRDTRESGLLHVYTVRRRIEEHFAGTRDHLRDLLWAADLALARRIFVARGTAASWAAP